VLSGGCVKKVSKVEASFIGALFSTSNNYWGSSLGVDITEI